MSARHIRLEFTADELREAAYALAVYEPRDNPRAAIDALIKMRAALAKEDATALRGTLRAKRALSK